ncbi:MAG: 4,5-DOPA dioxygenase extradiol [Bacteroidota bacterium]
MDRRNFIGSSFGALSLISLSSFRSFSDHLPASDKMPVLFVGHGNPMNAIEDNDFSRAWKKVAKDLPRPNAILCISAHWLTRGTYVTAMKQPRTIHDFGGFPPALFEKQYPAPGAPSYAEETVKLVTGTHVGLDHEWGLDHGTWSVLAQMFPEAELPVYQLSIDAARPPRWHYELAQELSALRRKGVLIIGSGNIVHNLGMVDWNGGAYPWALEFDAKAKQLIDQHDHDSLIDYDRLGSAARLSIPTNDHYLPLLYSIALQGKNEHHEYFAEQTVMGSVSMRSIRIG